MVDDRTRAEDEAAVEQCSDVYEDALRRHDVATLDRCFWDDPTVLRFGIADRQVGYAAVVAWRATAPPISPSRVITERHVVALAPGVVAVDLVFADDDTSIGRQSQTWVRTAEGWRIARAHVSVVPAT
jgi:ketosteroid isomerase-like protein